MTKHQAVRRSSSSEGSAKNGKLYRAAKIGLCLGLAVTLVVGFLIPLPDRNSDDPEGQNASTEEPKPTESAKLQPTLELPEGTERKDINVADLQLELKRLATTLTVDYPNDAACFHLAAQVQFELKQFEVAEQLWKKCLEVNPMYMGPYVGLATLLMDKGRNEDAIEVLGKAESLGGNSPEMLLKLGEAFENAGNLDSALQRLQQAALAYPENGEIWVALGRVQNQNNKPAEAEISLRRAIEIGGEKEPVLFALNAALMRQGKLQESAAIRESMTKLKQSKPFEQEPFQDRYDTALSRIAADVFISAATISEANEKLDDANKLYLRALELNPRNVEAYSGLLYVARRQERLPDQRLLLSKLIEYDSKNLLNYTNLASVAMQMGDARFAEKTLNDAVAMDPEGILAQAASAKLYLNLRNFTKARALAMQVVERQPSPAAFRLLAATYRAEGLEDKFIAAIQKADELEKANRNDLGP